MSLVEILRLTSKTEMHGRPKISVAVVQAPVVQTLDSAIHRINHYQRISIMETNCAIHWIEIYPVDSAIRPLNNRGQIDKVFNNYSSSPNALLSQ